MIVDLLLSAVDVLVAGIITVFLFLIILTLLTKALVALFPEQDSHSHAAIPHSRTDQQLPPQLSSAQQAAIAVAVQRYRRQHKH